MVGQRAPRDFAAQLGAAGLHARALVWQRFLRLWQRRRSRARARLAAAQGDAAGRREACLLYTSDAADDM
eukprot:4128675-Prymnesium_polylepis.1